MAGKHGRRNIAVPSAVERHGRAAERLLAQVFQCLADESRLRILFLLDRHGEMTVTSVCDELGQSQPAVSHHMTRLRSAGLVDFRRAGKFNFYRSDPNGVRALFEALFPNAPPRLSVGGLDIRPARE